MRLLSLPLVSPSYPSSNPVELPDTRPPARSAPSAAKKLKMLLLFTGATIRKDRRYGAGFLVKLFAVIAAVFAVRAKL